MKTETRTIFIADDGTEFDTEEGAKRQEHYMRVRRLLEAELSYDEASMAATLLLVRGTYTFNGD